jgi:hypothetical protein
MRVRLLLLLLSLVGCASAGRAGAGREGDPRTDWRAFWAAVAPHARAGALGYGGNTIAFNQAFEGEVEWSGTLRSLRFHDGGTVTVELDMPQVLVPLPDGSSVAVRELTLSCSPRERPCGGWSRELVGREVRFRTSLENRTRGYRPVVTVERIGKERSIDIEAHGAELVGTGSR